MKNPVTLAGIEPAIFRFVAQHLNHCAAANGNEYQGIFLRGTVRSARGADDCAVQAVPNYKVRMEVQHSILPLRLHYLLLRRFANCRSDEGLHQFQNKWLV